MFLESPYFELIISYLDVPSAIRLRGTCRQAVTNCSSVSLVDWRQRIVLPTLKKKVTDDFFGFPIMTDQHTTWLYDNGERVTKAAFGPAPFITNSLLIKIATECPALEYFSMRRGSDMLRVRFHALLSRLTTGGPCALVERCPRLNHLCLSWCENVDAEELCQSIQSNKALCNGLTYLNLDGVPRITNSVICALASCTNLETLRMRDVSATDLSPLAACAKLCCLHACRGRNIESESVVVACGGFRETVRELCCAGCWNINRETALAVLDMCPRLEVWNCVRGTGIGPASEILSAASRRDGLKVCLDEPNCGDQFRYDYLESNVSGPTG